MESFAYTSLSALEAHEGHTEAALRAAEEAARLNPNHTSIQLTLGRALERAGRAGDATAAYRRAIELDPRASEPREALARLTFSGASVEEMAMKTGLDALYVRQDPSAAATEFRRVLELNPTHYGANFQLAIALDRAGKPAEARPVWEKVLKMAEGNKDAKTATWVKNRLARRP